MIYVIYCLAVGLGLVLLLQGFKSFFSWVKKRDWLDPEELHNYDEVTMIHQNGGYLYKISSGKKWAYVGKTAFQTKDGNSKIASVELTNKREKAIRNKPDEEILDSLHEFLDSLQPNGVIARRKRQEKKALKQPSEFVMDLSKDLEKAYQRKDKAEIKRITETLTRDIV